MMVKVYKMIRLPSFLSASICNAIVSYSIWICLHYVSIHLYARFCAPLTWYGFFTSAFMVSTPQCRALRWTIVNGGSHLEMMWILLGSWFLTQIILTNHKPHQDNDIL